MNVQTVGMTSLEIGVSLYCYDSFLNSPAREIIPYIIGNLSNNNKLLPPFAIASVRMPEHGGMLGNENCNRKRAYVVTFC